VFRKQLLCDADCVLDHESDSKFVEKYSGGGKNLLQTDPNSLIQGASTFSTTYLWLFSRRPRQCSTIPYLVPCRCHRQFARDFPVCRIRVVPKCPPNRLFEPGLRKSSISENDGINAKEDRHHEISDSLARPDASICTLMLEPQVRTKDPSFRPKRDGCNKL
jgi:hypothetical protein